MTLGKVYPIPAGLRMDVVLEHSFEERGIFLNLTILSATPAPQGPPPPSPSGTRPPAPVVTAVTMLCKEYAATFKTM